MSRRRVFLLADAGLVLIAAGFVFYMATSSYEQPYETTAEAIEELLEEDENSDGPRPPIGGPDTEAVKFDWEGGLGSMMNPVYTLTATPTPTPRSTPPPFKLEEMIYSWKLVSMEANSVTVMDERTKKEFDMALGGKARAVEFKKQSMNVQLCGIDLNELQAEFCAGAERVIKKF